VNGGFWDDGACVLRSVVSPEIVRTVSAAIDELAGSNELADLSALADSDDSARFVAGVDHWRTHPEFAEVGTDSAIPRLVADVLGSERLWLYEDSVLIKEAGSTVETRWHTDDGYFHVEGEQLATVWLPVDPAPLDAGALRFVRGSHRGHERFRPTLFVTDDPIPGTAGEQPPHVDSGDPRVFGFDLAVGDLTVHHARTLHAAGPNRTDQPRRALSIRYCGDDAVVRIKAGAPPKPGFDAVAPGTSIADAAPQLGLREATQS
jgi:ectoine hydroxylase-related dioxygenase (phytanoyl-CoA dioxygenase family)